MSNIYLNICFFLLGECTVITIKPVPVQIVRNTNWFVKTLKIPLSTKCSHHQSPGRRDDNDQRRCLFASNRCICIILSTLAYTIHTIYVHSSTAFPNMMLSAHFRTTAHSERERVLQSNDLASSRTYCQTYWSMFGYICVCVRMWGVSEWFVPDYWTYSV